MGALDLFNKMNQAGMKVADKVQDKEEMPKGILALVKKSYRSKQAEMNQAGFKVVKAEEKE